MKKIKSIKVTLSIAFSDILGKDLKPIFPPEIFVKLRGIDVWITKGPKTRDIEEKKFKSYNLNKALYQKFMEETKYLIKKYHGKPVLRSITAENIPLEEIKDTALMKFVLKKLGMKV